jgi:formylmethanofuran dehydrogenase subunit C
MMRVTLTVKQRKKPWLPIEAESIVPRNFLDTGHDMAVWKGNRRHELDEIFSVEVEGEAETPGEVEIVIAGDSSRIKRVGEYMDGGRIHILGDIGMHCGNFMSSGTIEIEGNADAWLGREMEGGTIVCRGDAGDYCGSGYRGEKRGMRGGRLEIFGDAGDFAAETLSGGTVVIHGNAGDMPGIEMKEGLLVVKGSCTRACGNMTGGTAWFCGKVGDMLPTFRRTGSLVRDGITFTRFAGDIANRGKGTLFIKDYQYMD